VCEGKVVLQLIDGYKMWMERLMDIEIRMENMDVTITSSTRIYIHFPSLNNDSKHHARQYLRAYGAGWRRFKPGLEMSL